MRYAACLRHAAHWLLLTGEERAVRYALARPRWGKHKSALELCCLGCPDDATTIRARVVVLEQHARAMGEMPTAFAQHATAQQVESEATPSALNDAKDATQPHAVVFSVYNYGFRFLREELDLLEDVFQQNGGATPSHGDLRRIAAAMSAAPVRLAEPPHPVREKQIKTWFENRRQKLRRQRDQKAAGCSGPGSKRLHSNEEEKEHVDGGAAATSPAYRLYASLRSLLRVCVLTAAPCFNQPRGCQRHGGSDRAAGSISGGAQASGRGAAEAAVSAHACARRAAPGRARS